MSSGPDWFRLPGDFRPPVLGLAVSGGGDSIALLRAAADSLQDIRLDVATVDHGLRPEAADEAAFVARTCTGLGLRHDTLRWEGWDGTGNLQAEARAARYRLLADWARQRGCDAVLLGHTADDQAETVLMNFARGSGVSGLAGMTERVETAGMTFLRPLLAASRAELRAWLRDRGQDWIDDPSNEDPAYTRVRARKLLASLEPLGLSRDRLTDTALRMQEADAVLRDRALALADAIELQAGDVLLPRDAFDAAPADTRHRVLAAILRTLSGQPYPPRFRPLRALAQAQDGVLHGCRVTSARGRIRITREAAALAGVTAQPGAPWDGRFRITGPFVAGDVIAAMGAAAEGPLPEARDTRLPRISLAAAPAVWRAGEMIAAPLAGIGVGWTCVALQRKEDFRAALGG
ncbi:tRNA lysidine(34) synthetase TilS [Tropicimonas sp. IMCC6043]|uniref:tRNA lysidine(34) synthetase TilS n=1 Tax=Tropicimonas sp. IMCC6043 TaxID=2510645 RepID=UPI00101C0A12|nr:tRNA lysidine(34) synthetase TilS [Tropicimonas sp. IMCC6043]RYH06898.1 tRNA lysidine(34) synthetase TilS [Tropicimonas sp. IMCC6043]